jgi:hypothetical protein
MEKKAWQRESWIGSEWVWRRPKKDLPILIALPRTFLFPFQSRGLWDQKEPEGRFQNLRSYSVGVLASIARWKRETRPKKIHWSGKKVWRAWRGLETLAWKREKSPWLQFPGLTFLAWNSWLKIGVVTENTGRFDPLRMGFGLLVLLRGQDGKFPDPSLVGYWASKLAAWAYAANLVWLLAPTLRTDLDFLIGAWGDGRIEWEELVEKTEDLAIEAKRKAFSKNKEKIVRIQELRAKASGTGG